MALNLWLFYGAIVDDWGLGYENSTNEGDYPELDLSAEIALTDDNQIQELLDRLDLILAHGQISQRSKDFMIPVIQEMPTLGYNDENTLFLKRQRVNMAIYLMMSSPEYLINR